MRQGKWDAKLNAMLVIEGLQGKPVAEICTAQQISQPRYYQGRDQLWANASTAFAVQTAAPARSQPVPGARSVEGHRRGTYLRVKKVTRYADESAVVCLSQLWQCRPP